MENKNEYEVLESQANFCAVVRFNLANYSPNNGYLHFFLSLDITNMMKFVFYLDAALLRSFKLFFDLNTLYALNYHRSEQRRVFQCVIAIVYGATNKNTSLTPLALRLFNSFPPFLILIPDYICKHILLCGLTAHRKKLLRKSI